MGVDASELRELGRDFGRAPARHRAAARRVVRKAAVEVKRRMRADLQAGLSARAGSYLPELVSKINFDMKGPLAAEIGIDKVGQGHLGNFAAFGSINNGAVFDHTDSLTAETPVFVDKLGEAAEKSVLGGAE